MALVAVFALLGVALQASAAFPTAAPAAAPAAAPQGLGAQSAVSQGKSESAGAQGQYDTWIQPSRPSPDDPFGVKGIDCSLVERLHLDKQMNKWAGAVVDYCAAQSGEKPAQSSSGSANVFERLLGPLAYGGVDKNLITQVETTTRNVQSESWVWGNGQTIVVTYNDSSSFSTNGLLCGASYSTDGGTNWTRIQPSPFSGLGQCSGDPFHFWSESANKWYAHFFAASCGNDIGQWESNDGIAWTPSGCVTSVGSQDRFSGWVDNNPASPFYGRQYVS
ncbi:MAG TPA: hypothetical protein VFR15_07830, partial [Chloroflexia bacterium]|nr:hypothetical protein [Chloroflexia bacterium]